VTDSGHTCSNAATPRSSRRRCLQNYMHCAYIRKATDNKGIDNRRSREQVIKRAKRKEGKPMIMTASTRHLTGSARVDLAEHNLLKLVIQGEHTSTGNTTEDIGTSTLEQRFGTFLGNNLGTSIKHRLIVDT